MYDTDAKLQFARSNLFDVVMGTGNGSSINGPASRYFVRANSAQGKEIWSPCAIRCDRAL